MILITFSTLVQTIARRLKRGFGACRAMWCRLTKSRTACSISIRNHRPNHPSPLWRKPSVGTTKEIVHVASPHPLRLAHDKYQHRASSRQPKDRMGEGARAGAESLPRQANLSRQASGVQPSLHDLPQQSKGVTMKEVNYIYCRACMKTVYYTVANTVIFFFKDYRWYSAAQTVCDYCNYRQSFFLYPNLDWELRWCVEHDIGFVVIDGKPDKYQAVYDSFHDFYPNFPKEKELSELDEKEILFLAWLIEHYDSRFFDDIERGQM